MKSKALYWLLPLALLAAASAPADTLRMYGAQEVPDPGEIADILRKPGTGGGGAKMRGIALDSSYQSGAGAAPVAVVGEPAPAAGDSFALPIRFAFDSAGILPEAEPQLDAVAEGIQLVPDARVLVEGHTDAYGSDRYNRRLSLARAESVKHYLVARHGISPERLLVQGLGEAAPYNQADPYAPENRRVQFQAAY